MGVFTALTKHLCRLSLLLNLFFFVPTSAVTVDVGPDFSGREGGRVDDIATSFAPPPPPPPPQPLDDVPQRNSSPLRPSIAVIVAILTTLFSITLLLLLYAKHCKRRNGYPDNNNSRGIVTHTARKNSGIDRTVVDSMPVFRFRSLRGQKEGLECAVCLNRFDPAELLRLLPKCRHAFHVECIDTWLDAHSTCPLCRYRVDPEDILLVGDNRILHEPEQNHHPPPTDEEKEMPVRRLSGRHSSAGERRTGLLQIVVERPDSPERARRSLDSSVLKRVTSSESVSVGCFDRPRKDGLLLGDVAVASDRKSNDRRLEHRIVVSGPGSSSSSGGGFLRRWSDAHASDLLYLQSEMIITDSGGGGGGGWRRRERESGRSVINERSMSEITGLSRLIGGRKSNGDKRQAGVGSRWSAWISQSQPAVRPRRPEL